MRTKLPDFWQIKAKNTAEAVIIRPYADEMSIKGKCSSWNIDDCKKYYLQVEGDEYYGGNYDPNPKAETITINEFQTLVLGKNLESNYEIY